MTEEALRNAMPEAQALSQELEVEGWQAARVTPTKIRYWCPGPDCRHQTWVELRPKSKTYFQNVRNSLHSKTCWKGVPK